MRRSLVYWGIAAIMLALGILALAPRAAQAIPTLQLYIEGSTWDPATETWVATGDHPKLWVMGDVHNYGPILGVKLTVAFPTTLPVGTLSITPALATPGQLPPPGDPSLPPVPSLVTNPSSALSPSGACGNNGTVGAIPCLGNGKPLAQHGEYGSGIQWREYLLGDLTKTDSPIGDYTQSVPVPPFPSTGQINAYQVDISGFTTGTIIHFDAFNHIVQNNHKNKYVFAPFSHDAEDHPVPEPPTVWVLGSGLLIFAAALGARAWRQSRRK